MKLTNENLPMIAGIVRKLSKNNLVLNTRHFYPTSKRFNSIRKKLGLYENHVESSTIHKFPIKDINIHEALISDSGKYININNGGDNEWNWKAFVIREGDVFTLKNNMVTILRNHPTNKKLKCLVKVWFTKY